MEWRTALNEEIQGMIDDNNYKFRGAYSSSAIREHETENKRIEKYMNDKLGDFYSLEIKKLEEELESNNSRFRNILLALPYIKEGIQEILNKYPQVFIIIKAGPMKSSGYPGISTIKSSISGNMLTDLYLIIAKCLNSIKSNIRSSEDLASADKIYNKSTSIDDKSIYKTISDHVLKRVVALHYIHQKNEFNRLLINGIRYEFVSEDKVPGPLDIYKKIGDKYLHLFIDPEISKIIDNTIFPENYGEWTSSEIHGIKHSNLHDILRINKLSEEELKRQELVNIEKRNRENYLYDYEVVCSMGEI